MIRASFMTLGKKVTTDALYQWDTNQTFQITGSGLTTAPPIHFGNKANEKAVIVQSKIVDGVIEAAIPNTLVAQPYPIYAFLVIIEDGVSNTKQVFEIPIITRPEPADYDFVDDLDVINYEYLSDRIVRFEDAVNERVNGLEDNINTFETNVTENVNRLQLIVESMSSLGIDAALGMFNKITTFEEDGSVLETGEGWTKTTIFNDDGTIDEIMSTTNSDGSIQTSVKRTTFESDDSIKEEIIESYITDPEEVNEE